MTTYFLNEKRNTQSSMQALKSHIFKTHFYYNKQLNLTISIIHKSKTNWHNIGTVLLFPRKGIHAILGTVKNM